MEYNKNMSIENLKRMIAEPASKKFFKKHGLPKAIKNHPLKKAIEHKKK